MKKRDAIKESKERVGKLRKKAKELLATLNEHELTVSDSIITLNALRIEIDRLFNDKRIKETVESLKPKLKTSDKKETKKFLALYEIVKDESITNATMLLEGLSGAIEGEIRREASTQPLSSLDIHMLD